jgi:hypothetical protein
MEGQEQPVDNVEQQRDPTPQDHNDQQEMLNEAQDQPLDQHEEDMGVSEDQQYEQHD